MGHFDTALIPHITIERLIAIYHQAKTMLTDLDKQVTAYNAIIASAGTDTRWNGLYISSNRSRGYGDSVSAIELRLKQDFWRDILNRANLRKYTTERRWDALQEKIEKGQIEEPTIEAVFATMTALQQNLEATITEKIVEAYKHLNPNYTMGLVTNHKSEQRGIGKKVILKVGYNSGYENYPGLYSASKDSLKSIEDAFYILSGTSQGTNYPYYGELCTAVEACHWGKGPANGETIWFRWKYYQNGNLHIEFKRMDLVKEIIRIAAEHNLAEST